MNKIFLFVSIFVCALQYKASAQIGHPAFSYQGRDSVLTYASDRYHKHSAFRLFFMGKNYRREWEQPVMLPVFRLSETKFTVKELGGGMQTKSLHLTDENGKQWALRTIDKDVSGAMPEALKNSVAEKLTQDQISAAMPYGSLIIGALAKSAGITAADPTVYFVADDPALGSYRSIFANSVCMLEERDPGYTTTASTETVLREVQASNDYLVNQKALLKARLFDMLIADWDRHYANWRWGQRDSAGLHILEAIPRDRDWAFYHSSGLVPKLMRLIALRFLINFDGKPKYLRSLSAKAHLFDGVFLNALSADDWRQGIEELQHSLTDPVISAAVQKLPAAIFALDGKAMIQKLKGRRDGLLKEVMKYYSYLAKEVQIEGSNNNDTFMFAPADDGFTLRIYRQADDSNQAPVYERRFRRTETYRVIINGLGGDDRFVTDAGINSAIKLRLNGGTGSDCYDLRGTLRVEVNDTAAEDNHLPDTGKAKLVLH